MKLQESLLSLTRNTPLSAGVTSFLHDDNIVAEDITPLGGIFSNGRFAWLALGPRLCVIDLKTGQKLAAWTFGAALSLNATITCVCELPSPLHDNTNQLIVSLACDDIGGLVAVFHCNGSQVLRCIQTKTAVTQLTVVERTDGPLTCCDSLVVAGTELGEIIVFDLNRDALIQALKNTSQGYEHLVRNEQNMANLAFLSLDDISLIEEQREIATESEDHIAININDQSFIESEYVLRNPDGTVRMKAKKGHVNVTKLLYVPQLGSVVVGYNFGGFQIWNLVRMCLEYTSAVNVECLPVTHFGFQEPCDDPRAFCYLWVVYSASERTQDEACPLAVMYSLTYQGKRIPGSTQCLYQDFRSCTTRFELDLTCAEDATSTQVTGGRSIACHTYSVPSCLHGEADEGVINLCQLLWESWTDSPNAPVHHTMLLFDLDQWYKGQMPERWCLQNNTFMSVASVDSPCAPMDACLLVSTVAPFIHVQRLEEHFYPNSLQYSMAILSTEHTSQLFTPGVQRQIISTMNSIGPTVLLDPAPLYRQCVMAGLSPSHVCFARDATEQRKFLLSVALEARLDSFLKKSARAWASGAHASTGCSLQLFTEWAWARAMVMKESATELTGLGDMPDRNVFRCLEHCVQQLTLIVNLFDSVVTKCCNLIVPDALSDMEERCKSIGTVTTYFRLVHWFLSIGLLSESLDREAHAWHNQLRYPAEELAQSLRKRRIKLSCLEGASTSDDNAANRSCSLLYIDQLIERECGAELIHKLWRTDDNPSGLYPPPSLPALLRVYLLPEVADEHKHSLVLYLLLDLSAMLVDSRYEATLRRLMQFPTMFGLSNTAIKATQAFWHLDHRNFDFAIDQLQCLTGNTLTDWQHNVVLSSLLAQKKTQAALQYLHVRKPPPVQNNGSPRKERLEDWQSCCELYLARGLVLEAMDVIRPCVHSANSYSDKAAVLNFFFTSCKRSGQLSKVLQITLLPFEEEMFVKYLQSSGDAQCSEILVMYYMQQARYLEGQRYNNKLKQTARQHEPVYKSMESIDDTALDRGATRDMLVELMCSGLPRITAKVQATMDHILASPKVVNVKPMSVFVQAKSPKQLVYKSSFIQNSIENASETWIKKPVLARGMKRALQIEETPFICTPKLSKTRSIFDHSYTADLSTEGATPTKRQKMNEAWTPVSRQPQTEPSSVQNSRLSKDVLSMLNIPEVNKVPDWKIHTMERLERSGREATPQSILKVRRTVDREQPSPVDSRYLGDSDEELETASRVSNYTHTSDKHLRFAIPSSSNSSSSIEPDSTDKPDVESSPMVCDVTDGQIGDTAKANKISDSLTPEGQKRYRDNVKARLSHSISANSSLTEDHHSSFESIADIPMMIINPRYSGEHRRSRDSEPKDAVEKDHITINDTVGRNEPEDSVISVRSTSTPRSRPSIRSMSKERTSVTGNGRSGSKTPDDSPTGLVLSSPRPQRFKSRSNTPEARGKSPKASPNLQPIQEIPKLESSEDISSQKILRTPEKVMTETIVIESKTMVTTKIEVLSDSPKKEVDSAGDSPLRRSLRTRSRTPEIESPQPDTTVKTTRARSKTPERDSVSSPKLSAISKSARKKPLSRLVLEANIFSKINKTKPTDEEVVAPSVDETDVESAERDNVSVLKDLSDSIIECTPMKNKPANRPIADYEFSPILNKSVLGESQTSLLSNPSPSDVSMSDLTPLKPGTPFSTTFYDKSVLGGYKTGSDHSESNSPTELDVEKPKGNLFEYTASPIDPLGNESVLKDVSTTPGASAENSALTDDLDEPSVSFKETENTKDVQEEKQKIVEIVREIDEIEDQIETSLGSNTSASIQGESSDNDSNEDESSSCNDSENNDETDEDSNGLPNKAMIDKPQVISLDSSDDDTSLPSKRARMTPSPDSDSMTLQIDVDSNEDAEFDEPNSKDASDDLEKNIDSNVDEIMSDSSKGGNPMIAQNQDPLLLSIINKDKSKENDIVIAKESDSCLDEASTSAMDILNQCNYSLMTDDNSVLGTDRSEFDLSVPEASKPNREIVERKNSDSHIKIDVELMDTTDNSKEAEVISIDKLESSKLDSTSKCSDKNPVIQEVVLYTDVTEIGIDKKRATMKKASSTASTNISKCEKNEELTVEAKPVSPPAKMLARRKSVTGTKSEDATPKTPTRRRNSKDNETEKYCEDQETKQIETPKIVKRRSSVKSNKSDEITVSETHSEKPQVDTQSETTAKIVTRRRSSAKSTEESPKTPTKKAKKMDAPETPLRRSARRSSKQSEDDNSSVKSVESTQSKDSKADTDSVKSNRKSRKSIGVSTKPELSVIPEIEDSGMSRLEDNSQLIQDYSSNRRLTRQQRSILERSLTSAARPASAASAASALSAVSAVSVAGSETSYEESPRPDPFGVQPINPISLLNKNDFDGPRDADELSVVSEELQDSPEITTARSMRMRAVSETGSIRGLRQSRRLSTDLERAISPAPSLDGSVTGSPGRPRRSSFNKALDALATPRRRRLSQDVKEGDTESLPGSPRPQPSKEHEVSASPARRTRRNSSVASDVTPAQSPARRGLRSSSIAESSEGQEAKTIKKK